MKSCICKCMDLSSEYSKVDLAGCTYIYSYIQTPLFHFLVQPSACKNMQHWPILLWHKPSLICKNQCGAESRREYNDFVMTFLSTWTLFLSIVTNSGFSLEVNIHSNTRDGDWNEQLNKLLQITNKRARLFASSRLLWISVWREKCVSVCVSVGGCLWSLTLLGTFCSFWQACSVWVCGCVRGSDPSHLICPWNEMNNQPPSPPTPALLSGMNCEADISLCGGAGGQRELTTQWHCLCWRGAKVLGETLPVPASLAVSEIVGWVRLG